MQIYVSRNNQQLGPFEEAKVLAMLGSGDLSATDLAIRQGEQAWQPLAAICQGVSVSNPPIQAAQAASASRTTVRLNNSNDILQAVESWANANNFKLKSSVGNEKTYQRGLNLLVAPQMLKTRLENHELVLEIWIRFNLFARLSSLFIVPAEMGIESGGVRAVLLKSTARNRFNQLLAHLGQPLVV